MYTASKIFASDIISGELDRALEFFHLSLSIKTAFLVLAVNFLMRRHFDLLSQTPL